MSTLRTTAAAFAALAVLATSVVPAFAAPIASAKSFDGGWSVLIVTEKGTCDRAYRYPVKIENGSVGYAGTASYLDRCFRRVLRHLDRRAPVLTNQGFYRSTLTALH